MSKVRKNIRPVKSVFISPFSIYWTKVNFILLFAGIFIIIIGYYFMSLGKWDNPIALVASPILLLIGYFVLLPLSIFYKKKQINPPEELKS